MTMWDAAFPIADTSSAVLLVDKRAFRRFLFGAGGV